MARRVAVHPVLETARLRLRRFHEDDVDAMHACFSDAETMQFWNSPVHTRRIDTERVVKRSMAGTPEYWQVWAVADAESDACVGMVNYHDGHVRNRRASVGYMVHPAWQGQGIGAEAVSAVVGFCFGELGMHRLEAFIVPGNVASRALAEKLGFVCEGVLRERLRVAGEWRDECLYARLRGA